MPELPPEEAQQQARKKREILETATTFEYDS